MAISFDSDYLEISIPIVRKISGALPFDIYIKRADTAFTKLFPKGEPVEEERLAFYQVGKGINSLFVRKEEYSQYLMFVEQVATAQFNIKDNSTSDEEKIRLVKEMTDLIMMDTYINMRFDEKTIKNAAVTVREYMSILEKDPTAFVKIFKLIMGHPYLMRHSFSTSIFSILLARKDGMTGEKTLLAVGMGGLLHDVGLSQLPFDTEEKEEITPEEWKQLKSHPQLGKQLLDAIKLVPSEVRNIVLQHHEQPNGMGYPNGTHDKQIFYLAKIVAICDTFTALISQRPFRKQAFTPLEALEAMREDRGKYDPKLLNVFSEMFVHLKKPA